MSDQLKHWQGLKQQALNGEMSMETELGERLAHECETLIDNLIKRKQEAKALGTLAGYGGLPSALDMKAKFERVAVGEGGAVERLDNLITVVETMRDTYLAAIGKLEEQDQATGRALGDAGL